MPQDETEIPSRRKLIILLAVIFLVVVSVEYLTRGMHSRRKVTLEVESGVEQALIIQHRENVSQILFAGNSLIFEDLQQLALQQELGPAFTVHTAGVPGSTYYDWRYGMRALFRRGSKPDVLVFSISPSQFLRPAAATPVPVSLLWKMKEILDYSRDENLNLTGRTDLVLVHYSTYFLLRDTVRTYVRKFIPGYEAMVQQWGGAAASSPGIAGSAAEAVFYEKLSGLLAECGPHIRFVLMIPPTNQFNDEALAPDLRRAAEKLGISIVEPIAEHEWPLVYFQQDGYHLTIAGAGEFSRLVADDLKQKLVDSPDRASGQ